MMFKDGDTIVFAGDSITDADKNTTWDGIGNGYVRLVRDALAAFFPQIRCRVFNAGVSGDNSRDLLARWEKDVDSREPSVVFCLIGANDIWRHFDYLDPEKPLVSEEEYERNLTCICQKAQRYDRFILITPYFMERNLSDEMRLFSERYAAIMRRVALKFGVPVLDAQKEFDAYMEYRSGMSISWDRVHPGAIGSMLLARMILKASESGDRFSPKNFNESGK
ncbi:MAG TPA: SGNH/GDSL hydrolase family protein [Firmicutes bacterium]|nr:SGNH/GDSL hydrolase family protein [Bacillota bacterium]